MSLPKAQLRHCSGPRRPAGSPTCNGSTEHAGDSLATNKTYTAGVYHIPTENFTLPAEFTDTERGSTMATRTTAAISISARIGRSEALWMGIVSHERLLTTGALLGLDRDDHVDVFHRHQRPCLSLMTGLSAWASPTGRATRSPALRRITRGRTRRRARVLLPALHQLLHGGLERRHTGFQRQNILLDFARSALPQCGR